ncbi:MAG TPA: pilus assembly protein TadG-related protein [Aquabacterium sp.]|uniref:pilus assembly protein TadG-related protein n=1 Tax=Aquabacterium sp. TaxID=1872578 RepID=UPI002E361A66|nr:pilus assembly protein TadG-related protein [Aquabacterium sp.]HEX5372295.1 pilus assembly protein TadG-related protein [Aquabacterium sp.]
MSKRASMTRPARQQRGAVAVLVGFTLVALVLMLGLVIDLGHLFVTKSELQNAADACALSAAREMNDLSTGAIDRITAAGITVGNRNRSDLQGEDVNILPEDVTFSDNPNGPYSRSVSSTTTHVRCAPHESNPKSVVLWFMGIAGLTDRELSAYAIAGLQGGSQSQCAIPLAMCTNSAGVLPNRGFTVGTWYGGRNSSGSASHGNYGWISFAGHGAANLADEIIGDGVCNVPVGSLVDMKSGITSSVSNAWNTRFGLYSAPYRADDNAAYPPDRTGYAYTPKQVDKNGVQVGPGTWDRPAPQNAYPDYVTRKNNTHDPYNPNSLLDDKGKPEKFYQSSLTATELAKGQDRRMVFVPVINCTDLVDGKKNIPVVDYACVLLITPIVDPAQDVQMEFRGFGQNTDCATTGAPGNTGTTVPKLVK